AHGTKDEICTLLRHKIVLSLCALQVTLSPELTGTYSDHGLVEIIPLATGIVYFAQNHIDTVALVRLQYICINKLHTQHVSDSDYKNADHTRHDLPFIPEIIDAKPDDHG